MVLRPYPIWFVHYPDVLRGDFTNIMVSHIRHTGIYIKGTILCFYVEENPPLQNITAAS